MAISQPFCLKYRHFNVQIEYRVARN